MPSHPPAPPEATVRRVLEERGELSYAVDPTPSVLSALVETIDETDANPGARLLLRTEQLNDEVEDFLFASLLANLEDRDALAYRTADGYPNANLLLLDDAILQLFELEGQLAGIVTDSEAVVEALERHAAKQWDTAAPYQLRTPPRSAVTEAFREEFGATAERDFTDILESLETARRHGAGLGEVTIALLVGANNEALFYEISKWGEDVGLASKATFSRTKSELEEVGILSTEKVPIEVGRPRLRLKFADERLRSASADQLASIVIEQIE